MNTLLVFLRMFRSFSKKYGKLLGKRRPDAEEAIKYQVPKFVLNGNLVHFAAFQKHIGFYPNPSGIDLPNREGLGAISFRQARAIRFDQKDRTLCTDAGSHPNHGRDEQSPASNREQ